MMKPETQFVFEDLKNIYFFIFFLLRMKLKPRGFYSNIPIFHHPAECSVTAITGSDQYSAVGEDLKL